MTGFEAIGAWSRFRPRGVPPAVSTVVARALRCGWPGRSACDAPMRHPVTEAFAGAAQTGAIASARSFA